MSAATSTTQNSQDSSKIGFIQKYALPYYFPCLNYLCVWAIYLTTNEPAYILAFVFSFLYVGRFLPKDNFPILHSKQNNKNIFQVFPLIADILFTWITLGKVFVDYPFQNYSTMQCIQGYIALMFVLPGSIDAAHELIHRPQMGLRIIGFMNMAVMQFSVYPIEHIYLHHKYVGTKRDPITCPKNKNFYLYTFEAWTSAHRFVYNWSKKAFAICMMANLTYLGILLTHAMSEYENWNMALWKVMVFYGISFGCFAFLELIEYIEHYGLICRDEKDEHKISEICSWNADINIINNWMIFRFQRHSDHHMNAYKVYTTLELTDKMPKFPFSFLDGSLYGLIPPLWYYIMNPYVDEVLENKPIAKGHRKFVYYLVLFSSTFVVLNSLKDAFFVYQVNSGGVI